MERIKRGKWNIIEAEKSWIIKKITKLKTIECYRSRDGKLKVR